jgi:hypothetical protein
MIVTIVIIIIGMTVKIGRTEAIWESGIKLTAHTTTSEPGTRETTGSGATIIRTAKRDTKRDTNRDRRGVFVMVGRRVDASPAPTGK